MKTDVDTEVGVQVTTPEKDALRDGYAIFNLVKVWGTIEAHHRGDMFNGGMTWVPDGRLSFAVPVPGAMDVEQAKVIFNDLIGSLRPAIS